MAASATKGPKGQPRFPATEPPDLGVDEEIVADYAALVGNRKSGTTAQRNLAASLGEVWPGLEWGDTTDGFDYGYTASGGWSRKIASVMPGIIVQTGHVTVTTNSNGDASIPLPKPFPSAIVSAFIQDAETNLGLGIAHTRYNHNSSSTSTVNFRIVGTSGSAVGNFTTQVSWMALGI